MNKYEDPTQRLTSHNWSKEYKENYEKIFGKKETWLERKERLAKTRCENNQTCTCKSREECEDKK